MQTLSLVGDKEENYYQLGLKDREQSCQVFNSLNALVKGNNKYIKFAQNLSAQLIFKQNIDNISLVKAYAEGLEKSIPEVLSFLIAPEIISGVSGVIPKVPQISFGCSSIFYLNAQKKMSHFRILDFPLGESYLNNERLIKYDFKQDPQAYTAFSASGFPFPSITAMNESGMTFALHQKFGNTFNKNGSPIFEIIEKLVSHAEDIQSTQEILSKHQSISSWGVYIGSTKEEKAIEIDFIGEAQVSREHEIKNGEFIYFNNTFINKNIKQETMQPFNFKNYCEDRKVDFHKKRNLP